MEFAHQAHLFYKILVIAQFLVVNTDTDTNPMAKQGKHGVNTVTYPEIARRMMSDASSCLLQDLDVLSESQTP